MKRLLTAVLAVLAAGALVTADLADARRLGGARNLGAQRQSVQPPASTPPAATPAPNAPAGAAANPVMPAQPGAAAATRAAPGAAAAPAASGASRWLGPVAGLAAGLGLAALASYLGLSEALMSVLLVVLIAVAAVALLRFILARRAPARTTMPYARTASAGPGAFDANLPPSAGGARFEPAFGGAKPAAEVVPPGVKLPPGFDAAAFVQQAKAQFHRLQAAYDKGDRKALADVMTADMFADVAQEIDARQSHVPTEVVSLNAEVVDVATEGDRHWASVRFRGLLREDGTPMPRPFDELWNLSKPVDGSTGWLLAGIRQLDAPPVGQA